MCVGETKQADIIYVLVLDELDEDGMAQSNEQAKNAADSDEEPSKPSPQSHW